MKANQNYRADLNGLRAIAVLLVVLFHLDIPLFKGGFLGVDVFFVLSGYFISRNIIHDLENGLFGFIRFSQKRLKRLFPVLIVTILLTLLAGYFMLSANLFVRLAESTQYAAFSASNFFFFFESGYFDTASKLKPLLHMWSLSVEEQFYLLWPLLLFVSFKYFKNIRFIALSLLFVGSLIFAELFISEHPIAVFFMLPFRVFEFGFGYWAISLEKRIKTYGNGLLEALFVSGLGLIIFSSCFFDDRTLMPGFISLWAIAGTTLVIVAGNARFSKVLLGNIILEYIGKASYSIYLVHWPLIVFYKQWTNDELMLGDISVLFLSSLFLGFLFWHFIENTFRYKKPKNKSFDIVWIYVPLSLFLIWSIAQMVRYNDGFPKEIEMIYSLDKEQIDLNKTRYFKKYQGKNFQASEENPSNVVIMGNSHSIDLIYMLKENGFQGNITRFNSLGKCYNFGASTNSKNDAETCQKQLDKNLKDPAWINAELILLHDNWPDYDFNGLSKVIQRIRSVSGATIYIIGPKMTYNKDIPDIIAQSEKKSPKEINEYANSYAKSDLKFRINDSIIKFINSRVQDTSISFIDLLSLQGGTDLNEFEIVDPEKPEILYFDFNHFTKEGATRLGARLKAAHPYLFTLNQ